MITMKMKCKFKVRWWYKPLLKMARAFVFITRRDIDQSRMVAFLCKHGIKKEFTTERC